MSQADIAKQITNFLYVYLDGESEDLPMDEYATEARELLKNIDKDTKPHAIAAQLAEIFSSSFEHPYTIDDFREAGESIKRILIN